MSREVIRFVHQQTFGRSRRSTLLMCYSMCALIFVGDMLSPFWPPGVYAAPAALAGWRAADAVTLTMVVTALILVGGIDPLMNGMYPYSIALHRGLGIGAVWFVVAITRA